MRSVQQRLAGAAVTKNAMCSAASRPILAPLPALHTKVVVSHTARSVAPIYGRKRPAPRKSMMASFVAGKVHVSPSSVRHQDGAIRPITTQGGNLAQQGAQSIGNGARIKPETVVGSLRRCFVARMRFEITVAIALCWQAARCGPESSSAPAVGGPSSVAADSVRFTTMKTVVPWCRRHCTGGKQAISRNSGGRAPPAGAHRRPQPPSSRNQAVANGWARTAGLHEAAHQNGGAGVSGRCGSGAKSMA